MRERALTLSLGDRLVVSGGRGAFAGGERDIGPEVNDQALLSVPMGTGSVVVTRAEMIGERLGDLAQDARMRGVYLQSLHRGTEAMPREAWTRLERGDVLHVIGAPAAVKRSAGASGYHAHT